MDDVNKRISNYLAGQGDINIATVDSGGNYGFLLLLL